MTLFAVLHFQAFRAYYLKLSDIVSYEFNIFLFIVGMMICINGTLLVYFNDRGLPDSKERGKIHLGFTYFYIISSAIYLFSMLSIINNNPQHFSINIKF
jgi:hypothetical protein